jgi:hypothetical protein
MKHNMKQLKLADATQPLMGNKPKKKKKNYIRHFGVAGALVFNRGRRALFGGELREIAL